MPDEKPSAPSYACYLKVRELLDLQHCLSSPAEHDETLFIIIHQAYELWFKQILHEVDTIMELLGQDQVRRATWFLKRVVEIQKLLVQQIGVLETMAPTDFLRFRDRLNPASGFQSFQFRELEFVAGLRNPWYFEPFKSEPDLSARLKRRFEGPTLGDAWEDLVRRRGLDFPPLASDAATASGVGAGVAAAELERCREARAQSLLAIYQEDGPHHELHALAEGLIEFDEQLLVWRYRHVGMVERMIGHKIGTGGSEGVGYLQTTLSKKCFPELWQIRTRLGTGGYGQAENIGKGR